MLQNSKAHLLTNTNTGSPNQYLSTLENKQLNSKHMLGNEESQFEIEILSYFDAII